MSDLQTHYDETHEELAKANQRIAELEAEHRDCLQTITDMQSKWEEVQVENDTLRDYVAILTDKEGPNDEQKK